ncbi:MAG: tripartite tricarboxylate transporter TctB family protein [Betaproteobacteria bacterium]|nr:tripartite tricarboxylate transporter TctB family protein [Betaproteobacteria bacterium]NBT11427.1 tripartite tricarboxylate transporter TctB family protein [Betaproteobacteria bacterium]
MNTTTLNPTAALDQAPAEPAALAHESAAPAQEGIRELGPELGVAGFLMLLGALVVFDSLRMGAGWADDGPQSGYFPFYIGLMLVASSGFVLFKALACWMGREQAGGQPALLTRTFVGRDELKLVLAMLVPATLYVVAMGFVGLYASSIVLIAWFMRRHGGFGWPLCAAVSVGVPLTVFLVFERWFLVPLPKGPIEGLLGL